MPKRYPCAYEKEEEEEEEEGGALWVELVFGSPRDLVSVYEGLSYLRELVYEGELVDEGN